MSMKSPHRFQAMMSPKHFKVKSEEKGLRMSIPGREFFILAKIEGILFLFSDPKVFKWSHMEEPSKF